MLYPVYVHLGDAKHAHGATFPDFPGCFAAADEWQELPAAVQEAVQAHFHGEGQEAVPPPSDLVELTNDPEYRDGVWMLFDVDLSRIEARAVRLNISLPANLVKDIDDWATERHLTRSGFLADAAVQAMKRGRQRA